jgi:iron complex outermembrane recepter protein
MAQRLSGKTAGGPLAGPLVSLVMLGVPVLALGQVQAPPAEAPGKSQSKGPSKRESGAPPPTSTPEILIEGSRPEAPATPHPIERFDADFIAQTDGFTADEVLASVTADLPSTDQVVLIDGRETQVDISTIPAELIDRIEVSTSGQMPDGRPPIVGTVINVILKKTYNGATLAGRQRNSAAGGGGQSQLNASGGRTLGKWGARINFTRREQNALRASDRDFSRDQDHSAEGGADYRVPYGESPVVQAVSGTLSGVTDANGLPTAVALAPSSTSGQPLTASDFAGAPADTRSAAGLRRFNTADFLYLVAPSINDAINGEVSYDLTPKTKLRAGYGYQRSESHLSSPPPVTRAGARSVVPAAYNPFDQDVEIGLVHSGFGPVRRNSSTERQSGLLAAEGAFSETWNWNAHFELNHRLSDSETADLDAAKFAAALAAADPAQRFDPFADTGPGSANALLYPGLTSVRRSAGTSDDTKARVESGGELSQGWIAPLTLRLGVERSTNDSEQHIDPGASLGPALDTRSTLDSVRANASLDVPVFRVRNLETPAVLSLVSYSTRDQQRVTQTVGLPSASSNLNVETLTFGTLLNVPWFVPADARPGLYQLQTQLGVGTAHAGGKRFSTGGAGVIWAPSKPLTFRADFSKRLAPTPSLLYPLTVDYNQTLIDRLRSSSLAEGVEVVSRQPDAQAWPLVTRTLVTTEWVPPALEKLKLSLMYLQVEQEGQQRSFAAQDILDNEASLPGRVTRLPPTPEEIAEGLPGEVTLVDVTPFSGGQREDRSLALRVQYRDEIPGIGRVSWRAKGEHLLRSTNELLSGAHVVSTNDREVPPEWRVWTQADWRLGKWSAAAVYNYSSGGQYAGLGYSSFATLDLRVAYEVESPFGIRFGRRLRIGAGVQNVLDRAPPFANTLTGYRGGSPLGRSYEVNVRVPFGR